jgi:hypothetical protein
MSATKALTLARWPDAKRSSSDIEGGSAVTVPPGASRLSGFKRRAQSASTGPARESSFDRQMTQRGGLAVWQVFERPSTYAALPPPVGTRPEEWSQIHANDWGRRAIRLLRPVLTPSIDDSRALFVGGDPVLGHDLTSFEGDDARPALRWSDGTPTGFAVRDIASPGASMTFRVDVPWG